MTLLLVLFCSLVVPPHSFFFFTFLCVVYLCGAIFYSGFLYFVPGPAFFPLLGRNVNPQNKIYFNYDQKKMLPFSPSKIPKKGEKWYRSASPVRSLVLPASRRVISQGRSCWLISLDPTSPGHEV